jgi:hypothetical protein
MKTTTRIGRRAMSDPEIIPAVAERWFQARSEVVEPD